VACLLACHALGAHRCTHHPASSST
jgi:hypothetical protein